MDNHLEAPFMKFSSLIIQPADTEGKYPQRFSGAKLDAASARTVASNKYFPL